MKAVGYVRVSTAGQATEGVSLDAQRAKIEAWCTANGFELEAVHVDSGISGKRADNRPALQLALAQACKEKAALIVYSLSRLARSTKDAIAISERLSNAGADLVSLSERIDTTSAAGKMVFRMLAVLSEFERDLVSERTTVALAYKKNRGEHLGNCPYGFRGDGSGKLVQHAGEQANIAVIKGLRTSGMKLQGIQAELQRRGIQNRNGNSRWRLETLSVICR